MNKLEFLTEIDRVLAFYQRPDEQKQPGEFKDYGIWLDEIYKKVSWISAIQFRLVIDGLLDVRPRFRKDLDHRRILAVYNEIAERNGWKRTAERNCPDCRGLHYIDIWVKDKNGVEIKAVKGCPNCNSRYSGIHQDFTQIDPPYLNAPIVNLEKLRRIPPAFAQCLLTLADTMGHKPKQEIIDALVEATCQPSAKELALASAIKNPVQHRNEMVKKFIEAPPARVVEPAPVLVAAPAPAEEIPFEPEKEEKVNPNVAHVPKDLREKWSKDEPGEEEIPF